MTNDKGKAIEIFKYEHSEFGDQRNGYRVAFERTTPFIARFLWIISNEDISIVLGVFGFPHQPGISLLFLL